MKKMEINYHNKRFVALSNSSNGEVDSKTEFHYQQEGSILWATYSGTAIQFGTITGIVKEDNTLEFAYQHVNHANEIMTGRCTSTPEILPDGRIRLYEKWKWTCKDCSEGESTIEEKEL